MSLILRILLLVSAIGIAHCRGVGPPQANKTDEDSDSVIIDDDEEDEDEVDGDSDGDSDDVSD